MKLSVAPSWFILAVAVLVSAPLVYVSLDSERLVEVEVIAKQQIDIVVVSKNFLVRTSSRSPVFFDLDVVVENDATTALTYEVRPFTGAEWFASGPFDVSKGYATGTIQLGSSGYPPKDSESHALRILSQSGDLIAKGTIRLKIHEVYGVNSWLIATIGLIAAVLAIVQQVASAGRSRMLSMNAEQGAAADASTASHLPRS